MQVGRGGKRGPGYVIGYLDLWLDVARGRGVLFDGSDRGAATISVRIVVPGQEATWVAF